MRSADQTHPTRDQLSAYVAGKLNAVDSDDIANHLDQCESCCQVLNETPDDDTIVKLLQQSERETSVSPEQPELAKTLLPAASGETQPQGNSRTRFAEANEDVLNLPHELRNHSRYRIVELLGHGGMGDVYRAEHKVMNRQVALKVIKPQLVRNDDAVRRFRREVQAAARLRHSNIVTAFDAEQAGDLHYLVMEFVDGIDLDRVIREQGPLPVDVACNYIGQAAEGLQHAHESGMVHRDIKPHNLMIERQTGTISGDAVRVKILDFGLANLASDSAANIDQSESSKVENAGTMFGQLTQLGTMMGTPDYIAPEQAEDAHNADIRADIYSLGCTFYTLLTGKAPFSANSVVEKIRAHSEKQAAPITEFRDDVPDEIKAILRKMMAKDPGERYQTPAELVTALADTLPSGGPTQPRSVSRTISRRSWVLVGLIAACFALIAAATVFYIQTDYGVVRVEVADEEFQVQLHGETITMQDGETPVTIRTGDQHLVVRRADSDFEFVTDQFEIRRQGDLALRVEVIRGEVVVLKDGQRFDAKRLPKDKEVQLTISIRSGREIFEIEGQEVADNQVLDRLKQLVTENPNLTVLVDVGDGVDLASPRHFQLYRGLPDAVATTGARVKISERLMNATPPQLGSAKERMDRTNKLKQIGLALRLHHDVHGTFPAAVDGKGFDAGQPLLSWRVQLLPYLDDNDAAELYKKLRLDQPWNSKHNLALLNEMPSVFKTTDDPTRTTFLAFADERTAFDGVHGLKLSEFTDGLSNTIYAVDAGEGNAIPWTQPEDLPFVEEDPIRALGKSDFGDVFLALMADGSVEAIPYDIAPKMLYNLVVRNDNNTIDLTAERKLRQWSAGSPANQLHSNQLTEVLKFAGAHTGAVKCVAVSPDGTRIVSAGVDGTARIWNADNGKELHALLGHKGEIYCVAFSNDSQRILTGDRWGTIRHWDINGKLLESYKARDEKAWASSVSFSPDDKLAAVAWIDYSLQENIRVSLFEPGKPGFVRNLEPLPDTVSEPTHRIWTLEFSPDGQSLLVGGEYRLIGVWDVVTGNFVRRFNSLPSHPYHMALSADGQRLVTAQSNGHEALLLDVKTGQIIRKFVGHTGNINAVAISSDGRTVVTGSGARFDSEKKYTKSDDNSLRLWDAETGKEIERVDLNERITDIAFMPDGQSLIVSGGEATRDGSAELSRWSLSESLWPTGSPQRFPVNEIVVSFKMNSKGPEFKLNDEILEGRNELFERLRDEVAKDANLVVRLEGDLKPGAPDVGQLQSLVSGAGVQHIRLPEGFQQSHSNALRLLMRTEDQLAIESRLSRISGALDSYDKLHGRLPPASDAPGFDADGRPRLSWRVYLLPLLGERELFEQFHLDEAWDSEHNLNLLAKMPDAFKTTDDAEKTTFLAVVGPGTAYEGKAGLDIATFHDGRAKTAILVHAGDDKAVPWTQPVDLPFDAEDPLKMLGKLPFETKFLALFADMNVRMISTDLSTDSIRAMFTRAGRDKFEQ